MRRQNLTTFEAGHGFGLDHQKFKFGLAQGLCRRQQPGSELVAGRGFVTDPAQKIIWSNAQHIANPHQRRQIWLAGTRDVMAVASFGQTGAPGNFGVRQSQIAGGAPQG